jgi:enediyne biosynthesis protein E4
MEAGGKTQVAELQSGGSYISNNDSRLHFGLGRESQASHIEIRWPSGVTEKLDSVLADQFLTITEGRGLTFGSAPVRVQPIRAASR